MTISVSIAMHPHPGQYIVHNCLTRFRVLSCGRRWGKTTLGSGECFEVGSMGGKALWLAPTYAMTQVGWQPIHDHALHIPGVDISLSEKRVKFPNGGVIEVRSADNPQNLRSNAWDFVVFDEAAYIKRETWTEVIRPTLADRHGRALFISTPRGRNWFWELYQKGMAAEPDWFSFQYTTFDNPYIDEKEIKAAQAELPEIIFQQEFLAAFVDEAGGVFRRVQEAATSQKLDAPEPEHQYVCGVDLAMSTDYTVITVMDMTAHKLVFIDRFTRCDQPVIEDRVEAAIKRFGCISAWVEDNGIGAPIVSGLRRRGLPVRPFTTTNASKTEIVQTLQADLEHGNIKIIDDKILIGELLSFESKKTATGFTYSAPPGSHDDTVMSLAIANHACKRGERKLVFFGV